MPSRAAAGTSITRVRIWTRSATVWPPAALTAASISAAVAAALNLTRMGSVGPLLGAGPVVVAVADGEAGGGGGGGGGGGEPGGGAGGAVHAGHTSLVMPHDRQLGCRSPSGSAKCKVQSAK